MSKKTVAELRKYIVVNVAGAKDIATMYLNNIEVNHGKFSFGLPEIDDRFHIWRVPVKTSGEKIGEIVINARDGAIDLSKTTKPDILLERGLDSKQKKKKTTNKEPFISKLGNTVILGNSIEEISKLSAESINLVFTSPPYYNAKPEYSEYTTYDGYLDLMRKVIKVCGKVLSEGRFFVLNVSPVLLRRSARSESSKRIAVPFDFHRLFIEEGFEFVDDIHWVKPDGAGWSFGRGRRFAADRNPLQYKPVPVTEYILVYRKKTDKLIDWNIRKHPDQELVSKSKIDDGYETTNLWRINPSRSDVHPATFPLELAEKVVTYYSFVGDVVLDPFAGIGTTAQACIKLQRRFVMSEIEEKYVDHMKSWMESTPGLDLDGVEFINTDKPVTTNYKLGI